jgi:hypothetical protein
MTAYSDKLMLKFVTAHYVNLTENDIIPPLYLSVDCCETIESKIQLRELHLDIPPKNSLPTKTS